MTYEYLTVSRSTVGREARELPTPLPSQPSTHLPTQPATTEADQPTSPVSLVSRPPHHRYGLVWWRG